ncbi:uncharacterized protein LOC128602667 isoform X3 [Ictalurus furcatus]|uniref:uncharacterized protein LOC128602667 isoform X3 n=1 Tax=Ictalurus furcatus TaxID=66913 RepID=UPI00235045F3|nr:uncharacterized protein LOC128602667 isoform X3 [Ictalurus furcatus]
MVLQGFIILLFFISSSHDLNPKDPIPKDKASESTGNNTESLIRLCVTLPVILGIPAALMVVYLWKKMKISPRSQAMELQTIQH